MKHANNPSRPDPMPRGVATLTVVMILFFIMAMVAAYTNRNLIFEQRTSANNYHSVQALAATEAGIDWAVAMFNGGAIDDSCVGAAGNDDFRSRYLGLNFDGSFILPGEASGQIPAPSCVMTDAGWSCSCPSGPLATLVAVSADAPLVFRVQFVKAAAKYGPYSAAAYPGVISLRVRGCTGALSGSGGNVNDARACHISVPAAQVDGQANVRVALGLVSALPVPPVATLTAGKNITLAAGSSLYASNGDPNTGIVLHAGGVIDKAAAVTEFKGPAGTGSSSMELQGVSTLSGYANDTNIFFQSLFGMMPEDYKQQPATLVVNCGGTCTGSGQLTAARASNPTRVIWINGNLDIDQASPFGSDSQPIMVVVTGTVTISQAATIKGVIFSMDNMSWSAAGGVVNGALLTQKNFNATGTGTLIYDSEIVRRIHQSYGSFVRVPGSWHITPT